MILLTGATGIVGHFIAQYLLEDGYKIRAVKRSGSDIGRLAPWQDQIEWVDADLDDLAALQQAFEGVERVIHCAAVVSFHQKDKAEMMRVNVGGTANMVNLSIENGVKKFVYISSVAALGRKDGKDIIDENTKWESSKNNSNYAESKYQAELEVWRGQEEGLNMVILNPSSVLGPGKWDSSSMQIFKYANEGRIFYPPGEMNFVDVRDVAKITIRMIFNDIHSQRYIINSGKETYKKIFGLISENLNKPKPRIRVSYALLTFAYIFETIKSFLTRKKSIITRESLRLSKMSFFFSNEKIIQEIGYTFHSLEDSVVWTCAEIKKGVVD